MAKTIDEWIRRERAAKQQTQAEAAEIIGVSQVTFGHWELGTRVPGRLSHLTALADWGDSTPSALVKLCKPADKS